jgi:hypothetical protein
MSDKTRDLRHGEKRMALFSSEKGRDRASAQRAIEGLSQNDQIIALLEQQNELLRWMADWMHRQEAKG